MGLCLKLLAVIIISRVRAKARVYKGCSRDLSGSGCVRAGVTAGPGSYVMMVWLDMGCV